MSDIIRLLPDSVANQIAAGEVIQRPASVVKELVENAVDAGADNIKIIIKDAGRTLIQVVDNGSGMSVTDARMAFERHSTSKIIAAADLFALSTMGFRGEALASIAAVAQVELQTMRRDDTIGTCLRINGSRVESQEPVATAPGSNMMVKNLFFNVPARRKFLKKDAVELSNIMHEFERLALVNPGLELTIIHNESTLHQLLRGSLKQRIGQLFGKSMERQLIPVETETSLVRLSGFVSLPEHARRRGALQYFFVNGRNMRHPYFHKAVMQCYEQLISHEAQPNYFINFEVDPATIDVNIHPTKNEIKFENEQAIWQIMTAAIRESLGRYNAVPSIDFDVADRLDIPAFRPDGDALEALPVTDSNYNPFDMPQGKPHAATVSRPSVVNTWRNDSRSAVDDWEQLYSQFQAAVEQQPEVEAADDGDASAQGLMQLKGRYILAQNRAGLMVVDQHRAHLRVLYDRLLAGVKEGKLPSQNVLFPEVVKLTAAQDAMLRNVMDEVASVGFELSYMGDNDWAINGLPAVETAEGGPELLKSILSDLETGVTITRDSIRHTLALNIARSGAVRAGKSMTETEMDHLLSDLLSLPSPKYTPDGNLIIAEIPVEEIERRF